MTDLTNAGESRPAFAGRSRVRLAIPFNLIEPLFAAVDGAIIVAAGAIGGIAYQWALGGTAEDASFYAGLGLVASLAYVLVAHFLGLYRLSQLLDDERDGGRVWAGWCLAALVLAVVLFLFKSGGDASRGSVACFFAIGGAGLLVARFLGKRQLRSALVAGTIRGRRAVVIGTQGELAQFGRSDLLARFGLHEVDRITLPREEAPKRAASASIPHDDVLMQRIRDASAEEIVLALSWAGPQHIEALLERLRVLPLPVRLLPDRAVSTVLRHQTSMPQRLYMVEVQPAPLSALDRLTKRLLDVIVAATSLALLTPPLILAAIAIKLESKGPVIFRQRRHG